MLALAGIAPGMAVAADVPEGALTELGAGEGSVEVIAWAGYVEDGSTDAAYDWVTPFEEATSCQVNVKTGGTSDEMVQLMQSGEYDGVSASGDATQRLMAGGEVVEQGADRPVALPREPPVVLLDLLVAVPRLPLAVPHLHVADAALDEDRKRLFHLGDEVARKVVGLVLDGQ